VSSPASSDTWVLSPQVYFYLYKQAGLEDLPTAAVFFKYFIFSALTAALDSCSLTLTFSRATERDNGVQRGHDVRRVRPAPRSES